MPLKMKNPAHPGEVVADALNELRVSMVAAAKALGVTRQHLHNVISGKARVTAEMALRLEKGLGSTAETWLAMQINYDLATRSRSKESNGSKRRLKPKSLRFAVESQLDAHCAFFRKKAQDRPRGRNGRAEIRA